MRRFTLNPFENNISDMHKKHLCMSLCDIPANVSIQILHNLHYGCV